MFAPGSWCPQNSGVTVVEVTPTSSVTSDGSSDPSLRLRLLRALRVMARTATGVVVVSVSIRVSSSSQDALWWCRGHLWLRCRGRRPLRLHLPLRQWGGVLLLLLLASALLLLVQATMQSLQVTGLTWHRATQWTLHHEKAKRGSQTYVQCTSYGPSTKNIVSTRVRVEL
jgi:hypothetical protein